jgi:peptidoglycan/xylan/chitin deacetylase (PgdA/CDA1 family)
MIWRSLFTLLAPGGARARLSILIFHRVLRHRDPMYPETVDAERFDELCQWVQGWFHVLPLRDAVDRLYTGRLPARAMAITFDDGYADNEAIAAPILAKHRLPATFFVASGYLDGGCMWNDVVIEALRRAPMGRLDLRGVGAVDDDFRWTDDEGRRGVAERIIRKIKYLEPGDRLACARTIASLAQTQVPTDSMMTSAQVEQLSRRGFDIGGHTVTHPILARLPAAAARREIEDGRRRLAEITGRDVTLFAYPNGKPGADYGPEAVDLVRRAGFDAAVSTAWGVSTPSTDRFELTRFSPWDRQRSRFAARLAHNLVATRRSATLA